MSRVLRILLAITAVVHLPVAFGMAELGRRLGWSSPAPALLGLGWGVAGVALFVGRARAGMPDRRGRHPALVRLVDIPYFIHWCACLWTIVPALVATLVVPLVDLVRGDPVRLPASVYMYAYLSGLVVCGYGVLVRRRWYHVVERDVRVPGLDARLDGLRIAQLSDLHIGTLTPRSWGLAWSRAANDRAPDLAVVTGDMVTSGIDFHGDVADVIGALRAKSGVFVSMGNHDYFGAEGEPLVTMLRDRGVGVLRNEGVVIERGGAKLWLAAIDDTWTRRDDIARAMRDRPDGMTTVLLAHDPNRFDDAADAGANLVLSGHTHGGQIGVPFIYRVANLASFGYRYNVGFYRRGQSVLYVHPGLGTTGPPMRLGVAPEVTILVLRAA
jgi:predicted MPP superfamily phosphohydrolase